MTAPLFRIALLFVCLQAGGCSSFSAAGQRGAISRAKQVFHRGDYPTALKHLGRAEHFYRHEMTAGQKAEVVYFKARCLEMMGHPLEAARLYEYLIGSHPGTEYSARARGRIEEIHQTRTNPPAPALPTAPPVQ